MRRIRHSISYLLLCFPVLVFAQAEPTKQTVRQVEPFSMVSVLNMIMGLVVVVALILGLAWVLKKYGRLPVNNQVDMKILGGLSLGTREKAVLVQVDGKRLLLGVAPGRVATLHVLADSETSFDKQLNDVMEKQS